jgi:subtilase family serine protease
MRVGKDYWAIMTGTSMAAPAVAGIIAQWLQINPNLSPGQIKDIMAQTAIKDDYTNNPESGFRFGPNGKIDALAGARRVLGINYMIGDVNGNGLINIQDVTWLVDYLLEMPNENFVLEAADVFPDGTINIRDLTRLIDILLGL